MEELVVNSNLLTRKGIIEVDSVFKKLRSVVESFNEDLGIPAFQFPKLPKLLTESTCRYLLEERRILRDIHFDALGSGEVFIKKRKAQPSDLTMEIEGEKFPVEIKATASEKRFSYLTENDINAYILIFMDYYYYFQNGQSFICVYQILNVRDYGLTPKTKKNLLTFVKDQNIKPERIDIDQLFQDWRTSYKIA